MYTKLFTIQGYGSFYRSLLRFCKISSAEAQALIYMLNTANLDSYADSYPSRKYAESGPVRFLKRLETDYRPYHTEVQLYKAMTALDSNINYDVIIAGQREAVQRMRCLAAKLNSSFFKAFSMEIDDMRTVYAECAFGLVPREDEPSVCLMNDWLNLPSA